MPSFLQRVLRSLSKLAEPPPEPRQTISRFTQSRPSITGWEAHQRAPDKVEHELVFVASEKKFEYEVLASWQNHDPYAESSTSTVHKKYDVRDHGGAWEIQLVKRNFTATDGHPWEPAPKRLIRHLAEASNHPTIDSDSAIGSD